MGADRARVNGLQEHPTVNCLRRIGADLARLCRGDRQPLPPQIEVALSRIEREQSRAGYQHESLPSDVTLDQLDCCQGTMAAKTSRPGW